MESHAVTYEFIQLIIRKLARSRRCGHCRRRICPHMLSLFLLFTEELEKRRRKLYMNANGDEELFHEYTRLTFSEFESLHNRLKDRLQHLRSHRYPIDTIHRLAICLRYLGHGRSFHALGHEFRLGRSTVTAIVYEVCRAILAEFRHEALPLPTPETWKESADGFQNLWNYPRGIAAIDGKHFRCIAPINSGSSHFNYKGFFSIVLLLVVDSNYKILLLDCGGKGRISDSGLFRTSPIRRSLENAKASFPPSAPLGRHGTVEYHVLADGGFPQTSWMQRPFQQQEACRDAKKTHFNECFSSARRVVESVFGIICSRFRVFQAPLQGCPENMKLIIITACVLHNLLAKSLTRDELSSRYPHNVLDENEVARPSRAQTQDDARAQRRLVEYFAERDGYE
ncbi:unnamed protein product [Cylicostephanus goldi]|uniref:DDE Tnp4 domain-containing protein n=1 Tax=Cylicostephanus goldi TaxID=71465 RepID=A0A3P6PYL8_CYLGO|nr:unnamed protein product [Cylicostephanus goldi]